MTEKKTEAKNFYKILKQDAQLSQGNRAKLFAEQASNARLDYINKLKKERNKIMFELETKFDMSATVDSNIINLITNQNMANLDSEIEKYFKMMYDIKLLDIKIDLAVKDTFFKYDEND